MNDLKELIKSSPVEQAGFLDVSHFNIDDVETEAVLVHRREGLKVANEAGIPSQIMAYEGQVRIAERFQVLQGCSFPEILGVDIFTYDNISRKTYRWGIRIEDPTERKFLRRTGYRYYAATALDVYKVPMPISCLQSYERAQQLRVFDAYRVWERAASENDAKDRVYRSTTSFKVVEPDPYFVGVVRFEVPDRINLDEAGEPSGTVSMAPARYFLVDRWDEIDPMS